MGRTKTVYIDAQEPREVLQALVATMGLAAVHRATGLSLTNLKRLRDGETFRARRDTLAKLRAVQALPPVVSSRATLLRLEAAAAAGYSRKAVGKVSGHAGAPRIEPRITLDLAQRIIDAVTSLPEDGGAAYCAERAAARGALPRSAYDVDLFADPYWDGVGGVLADQPLSREEAIEEVQFLLAGGMSIETALKAVDRSPEWWKHVVHAERRQELRTLQRQREDLECAS